MKWTKEMKEEFSAAVEYYERVRDKDIANFADERKTECKRLITQLRYDLDNS